MAAWRLSPLIRALFLLVVPSCGFDFLWLHHKLQGIAQKKHTDFTASSTCRYKCDECSPNNPWYETTPDNITLKTLCTTRSKFGLTTKEPDFYKMGKYCENDAVIRDPKTCWKAAQALRHNHSNAAASRMFGVVVVFDDEEGCWTESNMTVTKTKVCFGRMHLGVPLLLQAVAIGIGLFVAVMAGGHEAPGGAEDFVRGAKMAVVRAVVTRGQSTFVLCYRFLTVVANVWLPMQVMIVINPVGVFAAYILCYLVPAGVFTGRRVWSNPALLIAPLDSSLFGLNTDPLAVRWVYAVWMIRPPIFLLMSVLMTKAFFQVYYLIDMQNPYGLKDIYNSETFYESFFSNDDAFLLIKAVVYSTIYGTLIHMVLSFMLFCTSCRCGLRRWLALPQDVIDARAQRVALAAARAAAAETEAEAEEAREKLFSEKPVLQQQKYWNVKILVAITILDFFSYIYTVFFFIVKNHKLLAFVTSASLWASMFVLFRRGHLRHANDSVVETIRGGIATTDFLALGDWDNAIAGLPALMTKIYGLPLFAFSNWIQCLTSMFFMFTGSLALATYAMELVDMDSWTHTVEPDTDEEVEIPWRHFRDGDGSSSASGSTHDGTESERDEE